MYIYIYIYIFQKKSRPIFCVKMVHGHFAKNSQGQVTHIFFIFVEHVPNAKFNLARMPGQGPALSGRAWEKWYECVEGSTFWKTKFWVILSISGPSRPQKWIRLEILVVKNVEWGLTSQNKRISWQVHYVNPTPRFESLNLSVSKWCRP